jgi:adenylate cyclase
MSIEIERKFLVADDRWRSLATKSIDIRQAYLSSGEHSSTRVRINDGRDATITIKSKGAKLRRVEVEYPISIADAEALVALREASLIRKIRHIVRSGDHNWEVDVFHGDNAGLVIAEIELSDEREHFERPQWLGVEVTGHQQYYNSSLARHPYCRWSIVWRSLAKAV